MCCSGLDESAAMVDGERPGVDRPWAMWCSDVCLGATVCECETYGSGEECVCSEVVTDVVLVWTELSKLVTGEVETVCDDV